MTKPDFMRELESLLMDIPIEEREEALQYYNDYFEDAGEDREEEISKELGSPEKVAKIIKADLSTNAADREASGYFTEKGYQDTVKNEYEIIGTAKKEEDNTDKTAGGNEAGSTQNTYDRYQQGAGFGQNGNQGQPQNAQTGTNSNTGLIILLLICTSFIWFPVVISLFGVAIGILAAIFGIVFGFGAAGVAMMGAGIAMFIFGFVQINVPLVGMVMIGGGLIVLGLGMLFIITSILLCKKVLPAFIKGFVELCRLPFKNRRVMA